MQSNGALWVRLKQLSPPCQCVLLQIELSSLFLVILDRVGLLIFIHLSDLKLRGSCLEDTFRNLLLSTF